MFLSTIHEKMGALGCFETVPYGFSVVFFFFFGTVALPGNSYHYHSTRERSVSSNYVYLEYRFGQA